MKDKFLSFAKKHKKLLIIVGIILIIIIGTNISNFVNRDKWSDLLLGEYLPEAKKGVLDTGSNLDDYLSITIKKTNSRYYHNYKDECIKMGYTIESKENGDRYEAFNEQGYELSIYKDSSNNISIILKAPEEMKEFEWPSQGLSAMLPKTNSNYGKIVSDSSSSFRVHIGKISLEEFNKYVEECKNKGFDVDYNKQDESYHAKNSGGYRLSVNYLGFNIIDILIQTPEKEDSSNTTTPKEENTGNSTDNGTEIRKEFKEAMDSYESYMNEYVEFMKKYYANPSDTSLLRDYTKMLEKYNKLTKDFENWKDNNLNTAEASYYLDVQTRVTKKLLEITNQ